MFVAAAAAATVIRNFGNDGDMHAGRDSGGGDGDLQLVN